MSRFEELLLRVFSRHIPVDGDTLHEIHETARLRVDDKGTAGRLLELASLVGLGLRLRRQIETDDNKREIFTQAAVLGSSLVTVGTAAWAHTSTHTAASPVLWWFTLILFAGLLARDLRVRTAILFTAGVIWFTAGDPTPPITTGLAIGTSLSAAGCWSLRIQPSTKPGVLTIAAAGTIGVWQLATDSILLSLELVTAIAAIFPLALLFVGWFDPRYALAATAVWVWRLTAVDVVDLVFRADELGRDTELNILALRWALMGAGVIAGTAVSQRALDRTCAL